MLIPAVREARGFTAAASGGASGPPPARPRQNTALPHCPTPRPSAHQWDDAGSTASATSPPWPHTRCTARSIMAPPKSPPPPWQKKWWNVPKETRDNCFAGAARRSHPARPPTAAPGPAAPGTRSLPHCPPGTPRGKPSPAAASAGSGRPHHRPTAAMPPGHSTSDRPNNSPGRQTN